MKQRIQDYKKISSKIMFERKDSATSIMEHDIVMWAGDLNFRINVKSMEEALTLLKDNKLEALLLKDQLTIEKRKGNIFKEFEEGLIHFWPTYKYAVGATTFDKHDDIVTLLGIANGSPAGAIASSSRASPSNNSSTPVSTHFRGVIISRLRHCSR